jgi:hypothetical protein
MYSNSRAALVSLSLLAAGFGCGGGDDDGNTADDAPIGDDGDVADGGPDTPADAPDTVTCANPDNCEWLEGYIGEVLRKLTGVEPAAPGVTITRRSTVAQRDVARQFLVDELTRNGLSPTLHDYGSGKNVVVHLASTTGSTMPRIVVGAHFDGVSAGPAAADNGTGTAIVVAAARYLASRPSRDRAIDLVLFDQEEGGLIGSTAYALKLRNDNTPVDSVHVMDMISYDGDGDNTLELWKPDAALEALYRAHAGPRSIPIAVNATFASSDHESFVSRGFATVGMCEEFSGGDSNPNYHRSSDTYANVNLAYTARMTRLILEVVEDKSLD